jgi:NADPH:quinone reductase-like Zn-dependent oxidoreductase
MTHALKRRPIDICRQRKEPSVVIGNAGVVRVLQPGRDVSGLAEGDLAYLFGAGVPWERFSYMRQALGYDCPGTMGLLAKRSVLPARCLIPIPRQGPLTIPEWAAFSLRFVSAWSNWKVAIACYRSQVSLDENPAPVVWAWGGGVSLAELLLARSVGCQVTMLTSKPQRMALVRKLGIEVIDRNAFPMLNFSAEKYRQDPTFREGYLQSEERFLQAVKERTNGHGVDIFIDNIGTPVARATLKALGHCGVLTTCGWHGGMDIQSVRAIEAINRHIHIHTHYARPEEGVAALKFAIANPWWKAPIEQQPTSWEEIGTLAQQQMEGKDDSWFPLYQVSTSLT